MTDRPWLSVLIPTYNGEAFLSSTLDSIILQADKDIECVVVDDGSTDGTLDILEAYRRRFPLIVQQPGRTGNWVKNSNLALSASRGKYACFLHQDDVWLGNRLLILKVLTEEYPDVILLLNSAYFIDAQGNRLGLWRCPLPSLPARIDRDLIMRRLLVQNFVPIPAPIFKREDALALGGMDENAWYTADWDFWLKLAARGASIYHPQPLAGFRIHPNSQTVLRSSSRDDFRAQHRAVAHKHLASWNVSNPERERVRRISDFSIEVNTELAGFMHGQRGHSFRLIGYLLSLGPANAYRYLRDSRIWERASARIKARVMESTR
jgi:GT2 family glycosyltransferase